MGKVSLSLSAKNRELFSLPETKPHPFPQLYERKPPNTDQGPSALSFARPFVDLTVYPSLNL